MKRSVWLSLIVGLLVQVLSVAFAAGLPETLREQTPIPVARAEACLSEEDNPRTQQRRDVLGANESKHKSHEFLPFQLLKKASTFISRHPSVAPLLLTFLLIKLAAQSLNLLLQYVSKRYGWSLAKVCPDLQPSFSDALLTELLAGRAPSFCSRWRESCTLCTRIACNCFFCIVKNESGYQRPLNSPSKHCFLGPGMSAPIIFIHTQVNDCW